MKVIDVIQLQPFTRINNKTIDDSGLIKLILNNTIGNSVITVNTIMTSTKTDTKTDTKTVLVYVFVLIVLLYIMFFNLSHKHNDL
jgi:hypothetical protein